MPTPTSPTLLPISTESSPYATPSPNKAHRARTVRDFSAMKASGEKIVMLTAYDASFAAVSQGAGVDVLLVGDSLGNVVQGCRDTLPVTIDNIEYHLRCVCRGAPQSFVIADLPFGSFQVSPEETFRHSARLMAAGANMVKLEGGALMAPTIKFLTERGIPVCAHIGLTPQSVQSLGGYRVQGRVSEEAKQLMSDALALEAAGAVMMVVEMVPADVATAITQALKKMATIGIGAGAGCDGQVLVVYDMLGIRTENGPRPRFVKNFLTGNDSIQSAIGGYVGAVKAGIFPAAEHCY